MWVSAFVGATVFLAIAGPKVLFPSSTEWLRWGDSVQHYLGWEFFRRSPLVQFPLGDSPLFGVGYASSVVYSDSIPLLAIPFKYLTFWFDGEFQYFGLWLLFCYVALHYVSNKILQEFGVERWPARVGATFFVIAPVFLFRQTILGYGHMALAGQFFLLMAFREAVGSHYRVRRWALLLVTSLLVQFYLFVMVAIVWATVVIAGVLRKSQTIRQACVRVVWNLGAVGLTMWTVGYFSSGNSSEDGFGVFRTDLATFWDPQTFTSTKWSSLLPDQPVVPSNVDGTFEGFAFLGLGILLAVALVTFAWALTRWRTPRRTGLADSRLRRLLPSSILCFAFSLSNVVTFRVERITITLPTPLQWLGDTLRASGRFVWPLTFTVMICSLVALARLLPKRAVLSVVVALLAIQLADSWSALRETRERFTQFSFKASSFDSEELARAAVGKSTLYVDPPQYKGLIWQDFAKFALDNGMSTNASYLSRVDYSRLSRSEVEIRNRLLTRNPEKGALYVSLPKSGSYASLMHQLNNTSGPLAKDVEALVVSGMLVVYRDD